MLTAPFRVVLDACVLYPMHLRDVLLQAAAEGLYQMHWSSEIIEETTRNLRATFAVSDASLLKLVTQMSKSFPEATVIGYEHLTGAMSNALKDRHVVAAAVKCGAQVIVTNNIRDFSPLPDGIEAQTADTFLFNLLGLDPERMKLALTKVCARSKKPPKQIVTVAEATRCPDFAKATLRLVAYDYNVEAIRFWGQPEDEMKALELTFDDGNQVRLALPTESLAGLERELVASLQRNAQRQAIGGVASTTLRPHPLRQPVTLGPPESIEAKRFTRASFHESEDGETILIRFWHPDGEATFAHLTNDGADVLVQATRNMRAFR